MPIYTKTGDDGTTALFGGKRVSKTDLRIETNGALDELTSHLGVVKTHLAGAVERGEVEAIQKDLYALMAYVAGAKEYLPDLITRTKNFEKRIDELDKKLPKLTVFLIPGANQLEAMLHVSRAVTRRVERLLVALTNADPLDPEVIKYVNRLSDLLFILARKASGGHDTKTK